MQNQENWSEAVEDLVDGGDIEAAISLLESTISNLETLHSSSSSDLKLSSALTELANLYSSQGLSTKSDELRTRAFLIKQRAQRIQSSPRVSNKKNIEEENRVLESNATTASASGASTCNGAASDDDDWETLADRGSIEAFSSQPGDGISKLSLEDSQLKISKLSLQDSQLKTPKRRGRGSFLYKKNSLYSDQHANDALSDNSDDEVTHHQTKGSTENQNSRYGTSHVLVVADFPSSTRTTDLEKLFENFRDGGVVIRWVNDTTALAVFRTPSIALEAHNTIRCSFTVRVLTKDDSLFGSISKRDLEPPVPRPKTSTRTAERLIAQGMGRKLPKETFGSSELRKQEEARRKRIVTRQALRDDAWGEDD